MNNPIDLSLVFVGDFDSSFIEKTTEMSEIAGQNVHLLDWLLNCLNLNYFRYLFLEKVFDSPLKGHS
jgi:hypothetical protein